MPYKSICAALGNFPEYKEKGEGFKHEQLKSLKDIE